MLQLRDITKSYTTGGFTQVALNKLSLNFRRQEFVAICGPSGSGKTTCLNVVGGLDQYDSGDLIINSKSTKDFRDAEWDAYRNNSVGFVFQSYNLITHLSVLTNVEMGLTLSGVSAKTRHKRAVELLERVGLKDHMHKYPNQLSGGQMQRVAIARALANDPDIIMMDEPTGALDTATSVQIMDLIKEISSEKLVIMVTHNIELAERYADRIVRFQDGRVISDTHPYEGEQETSDYRLKMTRMTFWTALKLSGRNIATKKWRTALTAFASSIGIIGIGLILSLSGGFQKQIDKFQNDTMTNMPIMVSQTAMAIDAKTLSNMNSQMASLVGKDKIHSSAPAVFPYDPAANSVAHTNLLTQDYLNYIKAIDPKICSSVGYTRMVGMNLLRRVDGKAEPVSIAIGLSNASGGKIDMSAMASRLNNMSSSGLTSYPDQLGDSGVSYLEQSYDLLAGQYPSDETGLVLVVDNDNKIDQKILKNLGFKTDNVESIGFDQIVGTELKLVANDDYYIKTPLGNFVPGTSFDKMYDAKNSLTLRISGIVRLKDSITFGIIGNGIAYSDKLVSRIIENAKDSEIVKAQQSSDLNVMTMQQMDASTRRSFLTYIGGDSTPFMIFLYPPTFADKDALLSYLDAYNVGRPEKDAVVYTDMADMFSNMSKGILNAISLVLIAFASISLVVSLIMIGIITYISVLERTKEIGILRALGARKNDIANVFNAETFIIGSCSGLLGIAISYLLTIPTNRIIENATNLSKVSQLNPLYAAGLVVISVVLTLIGGAIPAQIAARKDPVVALRTE